MRSAQVPIKADLVGYSVNIQLCPALVLRCRLYITATNAMANLSIGNTVAILDSDEAASLSMAHEVVLQSKRQVGLRLLLLVALPAVIS